MTRTIEITINGHLERVAASATLSTLIDLFKEYDGDLIVERNGRFVYPRYYADTIVQNGDVIEFINPNFGG